MKKFYPVIHYQNFDQVNKNIILAKKAKADGIFVINFTLIKHYTAISELVHIHQMPNFSIGLNFFEPYIFENLDQCIEWTKDIPYSMVWTDNAHTDDKDFILVDKILDKRQKINPHLKIFGGVHFKYQKQSLFSIEESVIRAKSFIDVITLSGKATGSAPEIEFVKQAFNAANKHELAIASGISIENIENYLPYCNNYLVASSILKENSEFFDLEKMKVLCNIIKQ